VRYATRVWFLGGKQFTASCAACDNKGTILHGASHTASVMSSRNPSHMKSASTGERRSANNNTYTSSTRPRNANSMGGEFENERRNSTSQSRKHSAAASGERRIERREVREREVEIRRTRSPLKHSSESRVNARSRTEKAPRQTERASAAAATSQRTPEEPQCMSGNLHSEIRKL
jgi:gamma-tubulin complex component 2